MTVPFWKQAIRSRSTFRSTGSREGLGLATTAALVPAANTVSAPAVPTLTAALRIKCATSDLEITGMQFGYLKEEGLIHWSANSFELNLVTGIASYTILGLEDERNSWYYTPSDICHLLDYVRVVEMERSTLDAGKICELVNVCSKVPLDPKLPTKLSAFDPNTDVEDVRAALFVLFLLSFLGSMPPTSSASGTLTLFPI